MFLQVRELTKVFSTRQGPLLVLENINLSVAQGEFVCAVGASGSGKSTLLRQIAGLDQPTRGGVWIDGQRVTGPGADRGMVFQHYTLYPWMTAQQNVEFGLELQGVPKRERRERARYYLQMVGLSHFTQALPRQLSGGMKQRVAIARALATEPRLLLLDEPFGALDLHTREMMHEFMLDLWQRTGLTVFMITHDVEEAVFLSTRIFALSARPGRIVREITVDLPDRSQGVMATKRHPRFHDYRDELVMLLRQTGQAAQRRAVAMAA
ncbi:MAG: ABC transporter ATP-binding protein [Gloeomargarita sp. SKYBB_i_bin120]|nr:ABC transporter ATP-binding protein [Gloeomargarita sp. SKYB120]MDW8177463.1 ABC transporter ATP-binding protein [Gloeomargarita sp. SKYBB_i_bin120]